MEVRSGDTYMYLVIRNATSFLTRVSGAQASRGCVSLWAMRSDGLLCVRLWARHWSHNGEHGGPSSDLPKFVV